MSIKEHKKTPLMNNPIPNRSDWEMTTVSLPRWLKEEIDEFKKVKYEPTFEALFRLLYREVKLRKEYLKNSKGEK